MRTAFHAAAALTFQKAAEAPGTSWNSLEQRAGGGRGSIFNLHISPVLAFRTALHKALRLWAPVPGVSSSVFSTLFPGSHLRRWIPGAEAPGPAEVRADRLQDLAAGHSLPRAASPASG